MCTNISIPRKSKEEHVISARTMDFFKKLPTTLQYVPRNQSFPQAESSEELHWKNKYGFIGIGHHFHNTSEYIYSDGMNEKGLTAAALLLPGSTYPDKDSSNSFLYPIHFVSYVLGNFKNINEVKSALTKITIIDTDKNLLTPQAPLHFIVSDSFGDHLIVEFINKKMLTYSNNLGILTNEPPYEWHITNLSNYENLSIHNIPNSIPANEQNGSGQRGSPGDPTSASRFTRAAFLQKNIYKTPTAKQSIHLALQILNNFTIPCGTVLKGNSNQDFYWTQWSIIRDHTNRSLYFQSAFNSRLYRINLNKINFSCTNQKQIQLEQPIWYHDISGRFHTFYCPIEFIVNNKEDFIFVYKSTMKTLSQLPSKVLFRILESYGHRQ